MVLVAVPTAVAVAQASASVELAGVQVVVLDVVVELLASELGPLDDARPGSTRVWKRSISQSPKHITKALRFNSNNPPLSLYVNM